MDKLMIPTSLLSLFLMVACSACTVPTAPISTPTSIVSTGRPPSTPTTTPIAVAEAPGSTTRPPAVKNVLAVESFLADIAQNVAGHRLVISPLIPTGIDPHSFEPTPSDAARVADCDLLIVHGAGLEGFLDPLLKNVGGQRRLIDATAGIAGREPREEGLGEHEEGSGHRHAIDPHFWMDPNNVVKYVENIRDGLSNADPEGASIYAANAASYVGRLRDLDGWIADQVSLLPRERRLLVTNHESLGYFADRYGFKIVGTVMPSVGTDASPSAQQMALLIDQINKNGVKAIFLETGSNPQLAQQIARETGIKVVTQLYTHSTTPPGGEAPTYIDMMRFNTRAIVEALR